MAVQGPALVNNGYAKYDDAFKEGDLPRPARNTPLRDSGDKPIHDTQGSVEAFPRGSIESALRSSINGYVSMDAADRTKYPFSPASVVFTGHYVRYPLQMFDRQAMVGDTLYVGLRVYDLTDVSNVHGTLSGKKVYFVQYMPFSGRKAALISENAITPAGGKAAADFNARVRGSGRTYSKAAFDNDEFDCIRTQDLERTAGVWTVGRVMDARATKLPGYENGPIDSSIGLTVDVNIKWCPSVRPFLVAFAAEKGSALDAFETFAAEHAAWRASGHSNAVGKEEFEFKLKMSHAPFLEKQLGMTVAGGVIVPVHVSAEKQDVLAAVQQDGDALQHASEELRADRDVVLAAVQQDGDALQHASEELRADREVVLAAVKQHGYALRFASDKLQADEEVVLAAVEQNGNALQYADPTLQAELQNRMAVDAMPFSASAAASSSTPITAAVSSIDAPTVAPATKAVSTAASATVGTAAAPAAIQARPPSSASPEAPAASAAVRAPAGQAAAATVSAAQQRVLEQRTRGAAPPASRTTTAPTARVTSAGVPPPASARSLMKQPRPGIASKAPVGAAAAARAAAVPQQSGSTVDAVFDALFKPSQASSSRAATTGNRAVSPAPSSGSDGPSAPEAPRPARRSRAPK